MDQYLVNHLFVHRLLALEADRVGQSVAGPVALVGDRHGRLEHYAGFAVDVELAAREPAEVAGVRGVEEQEWRLATGSKQVEAESAGIFFEAVFEAGLFRDGANEIGIEFEQDELVIPGRQNLHGSILASGPSALACGVR